MTVHVFIVAKPRRIRTSSSAPQKGNSEKMMTAMLGAAWRPGKVTYQGEASVAGLL